MKTTTTRSILSVRIREDIKQQAKIFAEKEHRSLSNFIEYLVLNWKKTHKEYNYPISNHEPNQETVRAIEESRSGHFAGTINTNSLDDFIQSCE